MFFFSSFKFVYWIRINSFIWLFFSLGWICVYASITYVCKKNFADIMVTRLLDLKIAIRPMIIDMNIPMISRIKLATIYLCECLLGYCSMQALLYSLRLSSIPDFCANNTLEETKKKQKRKEKWKKNYYFQILLIKKIDLDSNGLWLHWQYERMHFDIEKLIQDDKYESRTCSINSSSLTSVLRYSQCIDSEFLAQNEQLNAPQWYQL